MLNLLMRKNRFYRCRLADEMKKVDFMGDGVNMKKFFLISCGIMMFVSFLFGCKAEKDDLTWTNQNAVYAYVKAGYEEGILNNVEAAFESYSFQKVYVTEKNTNQWTPLSLLFVLENSGTVSQQAFIELLNKDERINHASKCRDLPFETVDTRYIEREKDTVSVGETLSLTIKRNIDYYVQPFDFGGLFVQPKRNKNYTVKDFRGIDLKSVKKEENDWLYLELKEEGYFNLIKASDKISRLSSIDITEPDKSNFCVIPPIWQVFDPSIAEFEDPYCIPTAVLRGILPGEVVVDFGGVKCNIAVK